MCKFNVFRFFVLALVASVVSGCISYSVVKNDGESIERNEGFILATAQARYLNSADGDIPLLELSYKSSPSSLSLGKIRFVEGETLQLIKAKKGRYFLTHSHFGFSFATFPEDLSFEVKPGEITYIGHFSGEVKMPKIGLGATRRIEVNDDLDKAKKALSDRYPILSKRYSVSNQALVGTLVDEIN